MVGDSRPSQARNSGNALAVVEHLDRACRDPCPRLALCDALALVDEEFAQRVGLLLADRDEPAHCLLAPRLGAPPEFRLQIGGVAKSRGAQALDDCRRRRAYMDEIAGRRHGRAAPHDFLPPSDERGTASTISKDNRIADFRGRPSVASIF